MMLHTGRNQLHFMQLKVLAESNVAQGTMDAGTAVRHSCLYFGLTWGRFLVDCFDSVQDCFKYPRLQHNLLQALSIKLPGLCQIYVTSLLFSLVFPLELHIDVLFGLLLHLLSHVRLDLQQLALRLQQTAEGLCHNRGVIVTTGRRISPVPARRLQNDVYLDEQVHKVIQLRRSQNNNTEPLHISLQCCGLPVESTAVLQVACQIAQLSAAHTAAAGSPGQAVGFAGQL